MTERDEMLALADELVNLKIYRQSDANLIIRATEAIRSFAKSRVPVAKLVKAPDLKSGSCAGSSPAGDTILSAALPAPAGESVTGWQEITEDNQPPLDTPLLLGWLREWPECKWEVEAGWYGSTKGGWNHGQATHWMGQPLAPTITRKSEAPS